MDLNRWIRQPTTIHALGVIAAAAGAALAHVATGNTTVDAVIATGAYVLVHLGIDDHSVGEQAVTALVGDLLPGSTASSAKAISDASAVVTALAPQLAPGNAGATP